MARMPRATKITGIDHYEAQDAVNTVARAHKHLQNPKMVAAMKAHMDGLNSAITGGLKPKPVGVRKRR
jgi:hypothetical protein